MMPFIHPMVGHVDTSGTVVTNLRKPVGDMQSGTDRRKLMGDMQSGTDVRKTRDTI